MVSCLWVTMGANFPCSGRCVFSVSSKNSLFLLASVRCGIWQHGGETNAKQNSTNLFMRGYQIFAILFYLYLFIRKGNAPVLSGTPGIYQVTGLTLRKYQLLGQSVPRSVSTPFGDLSAIVSTVSRIYDQ